MKKFLLLTVLTIAFLATTLDSNVFAQIPRKMNYQASLLDAQGRPLSGNPSMTFKIYDQEVGGTELWVEVQQVNPVYGFINVELGRDIPIELPFNKPYWLEISIANSAPFPRTPLLSTPYTMHALSSSRSDTASLALDVVDGAITLGKLAASAKVVAGGDVVGTYPVLNIDQTKLLDKLKPGKITQDMLNPNITFPPSGPAYGDLTGFYPGPSIRTGAVTNDKIASDAVTTEKIMNKTIISEDIADGGILTVNIGDRQVTSSKIALGAIFDEHVAANAAIQGTKIVPNFGNQNIITTGGLTFYGHSFNNPTTAGQVYMYDGANWIATSAGGDVTGLYNNLRVEKFWNRPLTGPATAANQLYIYDGTSWTPGLIMDANVANNASIAVTKLKGGAANTFLVNTAGTDASNTWAGLNLEAYNFTGNAIGTKLNLTLTGVTAGTYGTSYQVPTYTVDTYGRLTNAVNTTILATTVAGSDITLAGQAINTLNLQLNPDVVTTVEIKDGEVKTADIADLNVTTAKLADLSVTNAKLAANAVTPSKMDLTLDYPFLGNVTVGSLPNQIKFASNGVLTVGTLANTVTIDPSNGSIKANTVTANFIGNLTGTADLAKNLVNGNVGIVYQSGANTTTTFANGGAGQFLQMNGAMPQWSTVSGDLSVAVGGLFTIADNAVTTVKIADGAVTNAKITSLAGDKLTGNYTAGDLLGSPFTAPVIAANAVTTNKIAAKAVTLDKIGTLASPQNKYLVTDGAGGVKLVESGIILPYADTYMVTPPSADYNVFSLTLQNEPVTALAAKPTAVLLNLNSQEEKGYAGVFTSSHTNATLPTLLAATASTNVLGTAFEAIRGTMPAANPTKRYVARVIDNSGTNGRGLYVEAPSVVPNPPASPADLADIDEATVVIRNNAVPGVGETKMALKLYGDLGVNSTIWATDLRAYNQIIVGSGALTTTITPPMVVGGPINFTSKITTPSTVLADGPTVVTTKDYVDAATALLASYPYITVGNVAGLTGERAIATNATLTTTDGGANGSYTFGINLANANTWTAAQTFNGGILGTTAALTGNVTVGGTLGVTGATTLNGATTINNTLNVTGATTLAGLTAGASTLLSLAVTNNATVGGTLVVTGATTLNGATAINNTLNVTGATTLAGLSAGASTLLSLVVTNNATVGGTLGVTGHTSLTTLGTSGLATLNSLAVTNNATVGGTLGVTGATTLNGATTINNTLAVTGATTLSSTLGVTGNTTIGGTLGVTGHTSLTTLGTSGLATLNSLAVTNNATVGGTLGVTGATTLSSTLAVTGNTTIGGTLGVTGATTLNGATAVNNTLNVTGATTLASTLGVTGATTLASTLGVTGATTLASTLGVTGATTLNGATAVNNTLNVTGATTLGSTLGVTGNTTIGGTLGVTGHTSLTTLGTSGLATLNTATVTGVLTGSTANFSGDVALGGGTFDNPSANADLYVTGNIEADGIIYGTLSGPLVGVLSNADATITPNFTYDGTANKSFAVNQAFNYAWTGNQTWAGTSGFNGAVTVANTLTQTGAGNQVTFAGNVDATNGLDVTGANLTVGTNQLVVDQSNGFMSDATGNVTVNDNLDVLQSLNVTNSATVGNGVNVTAGGLTVAAGGASIVGGSTITGDLTVTGTTTTNILKVTGNINNSGSGVTISDNLTLTGKLTQAADKATYLGYSTVASAAALNTANLGTVISLTFSGAVNASTSFPTDVANGKVIYLVNTTALNVTINGLGGSGVTILPGDMKAFIYASGAWRGMP